MATSLGLAVVVLGLCANVIASPCGIEKSTAALNRTDGSPAGILKLLHEGEKLLELQEDDREMVVFLGLTGSGKTTFVLHIGGNDDDLTSIETRPRSGEYIIEDKCHRSSSASKTLESFTLIPDRFIDAETGISFYDMPGFSDTRPLVAYDIATTYFTKLVLDYARQVKLVFVVNHSHVKVAEDRGRFTELVNHITTMIRNVSKFTDSIALVVSKVSNTFDLTDRPTDFPYVPDEEVVLGVADFLADAKSFYLDNNNTEAAQLMDVFLQKRNDSYSRIGIFRRPDGAGPLKNVTSLQWNKRHLKAIIDTNIRFSNVTSSDFGHTLSEKTKNTLRKLREEVLRNATATIRALGQRIIAHFVLRENPDIDLDEMVAIFNESSIDVTSFKRLADFADYLETYAGHVGVNITAENTKELRDGEKVTNFLNRISEEADVDWSLTIRNGMEEAVNFVHYAKSWYILFLNTLYETLSGYKVQRARSTHGEASLQVLSVLELLSRRSVRGKVELHELDVFKSFLEEIARDEPVLPIYNSLEPTMIMDERKILFLVKVIDATMNTAEVDQTSCENNKLTIKGRYVLLSHIANQLQKCSSPQHIQVLASEKVFIDTSLNLAGKGVQVLIIAPVWFVTSQVKITLSGAAGMDYVATASPGSPRDGRDGTDGKPGLPGGSAGHFIGIGAHFVHGDRLTVYAEGGTGGTGQKGSDGYPGESREEAQPYDGEYSSLGSIWPGYRFRETRVYNSGFWRSFGYIVGVAKDRKIYEIKVYSPPGEDGGRGGDGGEGGAGGYRGKILVADFNLCRSSSTVRITSLDGYTGKAGEGGRGGKRGRAARTLEEIYTFQTYWWSDDSRRLNYAGYSYPVQDGSRDGVNGADGANSLKKKYPTHVTFSEPDDAVNDFKTFARNNLRYSLRKNALKEILQKLDNATISSLSFQEKLRACHSS